MPTRSGLVDRGLSVRHPGHTRHQSGIADRTQLSDVPAGQADRRATQDDDPGTVGRTHRRSPPGAEALPPDDSGYVYIETKSGKTRCQIDEVAVGCEAQFTSSPMQDGARANGVNLSADGSVDWVLGNLGDIPVVTIDYRTYSAVGWTIVASSEGTRFTNDRTGHGMFVSIEKVETY